jgi:acyl-CoA thioesterase FadM
MTHTFTAHFHIRQYELNSRDELPNSALARLFQETAMRASADAGYGIEWYTTHSSLWVIHQLTVEHLRAIRYGDELAVTTWLSDAQRVRCHREYLARDAATGEIVAHGRADWAHLDRYTLFPARIPADILERFEPNGIRAIPHVKPRAYPLPAHLAPIESHVTRHIQRYEADGMQHVNNAVYLDWFEEALADAVEDSILRLHSASLRSAQDALHLCVRRHDIEYVRAALPGDDVEIVARLVGAGRCASAWALEVTRAGELLVRDHITAFWRDANGRPARKQFSWDADERGP